MITILLSLILVTLVTASTLAIVAWRKVSVFLTWNTRYEAVAYEQAVKTPTRKKVEAPSITTQNGRAIKPVDDLIDLRDLSFDDGFAAVESLGNL